MAVNTHRRQGIPASGGWPKERSAKSWLSKKSSRTKCAITNLAQLTTRPNECKAFSLAETVGNATSQQRMDIEPRAVGRREGESEAPDRLRSQPTRGLARDMSGVVVKDDFDGGVRLEEILDQVAVW
jgi:hypothetical protein